MKKQNEPKGREFVIMNEDGEFFACIMYGQLVWTHDRKEAKSFDDLAKFKGLKQFYPHKEIIYDYI